MHHIALHHLALGSFTLDHVEPELGVHVKQAQAKDFTNLALDQGKPASNQCPCLLF
jgi:hypothetical protein